MKCPVKISKTYTKYRVVYELQKVEQKGKVSSDKREPGRNSVVPLDPCFSLISHIQSVTNSFSFYLLNIS